MGQRKNYSIGQRQRICAHLDCQVRYLFGTGVVHEANPASTVSLLIFLLVNSCARKNYAKYEAKSFGSGHGSTARCESISGETAGETRCALQEWSWVFRTPGT